MKWGVARVNNLDYELSSIINDLCRMDADCSNLNPRVDITEEGNGIRVHAEIAGIDEKDLSVTLHDGMLTIAGEKKNEKNNDAGGKYLHRERFFGSFSRSIPLPKDIDPETVKARYVNGVLEIEIQKSETARPRRIEISVN